MSNEFKVEIISPDRSILKTDTNLVIIPSFEGEMGILKDHIPLITFLRPGLIKIGEEEKKKYFVEEGTVEFSDNNLVYISYSHAIKRKSFTRIAMAKLVDNKLVDLNVIFSVDKKHYTPRAIHFGSRIVFKNGYIYFSVGDSFEREEAQSLNTPNGKIHRLTYSGEIPKDNPFKNEDFQYNNAQKIIMKVPSNDSMEITKNALLLLNRIYKKGYSYKKAGVIVSDIVPEGSRQLSLFTNKDPFKVNNVMKAIDKVNQAMGRNKVRLAVQGFDRKWRLKQEKLSPCYTTRFSDILTVKL